MFTGTVFHPTGFVDSLPSCLLAAAESEATVESGHICPLRRQRPTPLSLVRMTSWPPTLPCGRWPPLRSRFCATAQIRGLLSTPAARYERTLRILWPAQAAYVVGRRGEEENMRRQRAAKRWARAGRRWRSGRVARRAPCRAQQPSARSQPLDRQSLNVEFIKHFRLTLSHEGTTHCDLSKLRARHTKRRMNEGNAKKGSENVS